MRDFPSRSSTTLTMAESDGGYERSFVNPPNLETLKTGKCISCLSFAADVGCGLCGQHRDVCPQNP